VSVENPKLRPIQTHLVEHNGRPAILLRDPLRLSAEALVPQELGPLLALCDGTRDLSALRAALIVRAGLNLSPDAIRRLIDQLDENLLLDNQRFAAAKARALAEYHAAPHRPLTSAGQSYAADPQELRAALDAYMDAIADQPVPSLDGVRGLTCPHIDYPRGGAVYAQTWAALRQAAQEAESVIVFGTDHLGSDGQITLTRQNYATPWGVFPTDGEVVDAVAASIGPEAAFDEELHHLGEHSIELALVWLHYIRDGKPCRLTPVLCGGFAPFVAGERHPAEHPAFDGAVRVLRQAAAEPRTLVIAAADLAHVGPAFGDMLPYDYVAQMRLQEIDSRLIAQMERGDAQAFFEEIKAVGDKHHVCGLPPIYLALRTLGRTRGQRLGYMQCPADNRNTSWVSICGLAWTAE